MKPNYLNELEELNLPKDQYVIFGSGCLAARGIRENRDLDILIRLNLWVDLSKKLPINHNESGKPLQYKHVTLFYDLPHITYSDKIINEAEFIDGFPYMKLYYLVKLKKILGREKDLEDIKLITSYLKKIRQV